MPSSEIYAATAPSLVSRPAFSGGGGETVLAEDVDGGVHIAVSLDESLLALHHRGVGHLAELLDHSGGDLSHVHSFQRELTNEMRWVLLGDSLGSRSLGGHLGLGDLLLAGTGEAGVGEELAHELDRGDGVIVAGDAVIDDVGIGVGVDEGDRGCQDAWPP